MAKYYLGIDPGNTTGFAFFADWKLCGHGEIPGGVEGFIAWWNSLNISDYKLELIVENFVVEPSFVGVPVASEIIGAIKALWDGPMQIQQRSYKASLFHQKKPGDAGQSERIAWLKERGLEFESTHAMDAATHVLVNQKRNPQFWARYWA